MMDGILRKMELAALPFGAAEYGPAGSAQARVIVRDDELDAAQTTGDEAVEEGAPVTSASDNAIDTPSTRRCSSGPTPMADSTATSRTMPSWHMRS